ncbi:MAG: hypothetical protein ACM3KR_02445 [Deltaproteobacteria bacterium]
MNNSTEIPKFFVITATSIVNTGKVSWGYIFDSGANKNDLCFDYPYFGFVELAQKPDNFVNPFKLAHGEPGAIGDDGVKRWNANVFESGKGLVFGGGVDDSGDGIETLTQQLPASVLLMQQDIFDKFKAACEKNNILVEHFEYNGELKTA